MCGKGLEEVQGSQQLSGGLVMAEYRWYDLGNGRQVMRKVKDPKPARSSLAMPMISGAFDRPVQSMADGKYYDTSRDLERTYKADGNPFGQEFIPLGTENIKAPVYTPDPKKRRDDIRQAIQDVKSGNISPEIAAIT